MDKNARRVLNVVLLVLPFLALLLLSLGLRHEAPVEVAKPPVPEKVLFPETQVSNGRDWNLINNLKISSAEMLILKARLVKTEIESGYFEASPIVSADVPIPTYVAYADNFYKSDQNADIPLYFVLKIAEMARTGTPEVIIQRFKATVLERLNTAKLITE
jgi:hypothetical protein